MDRIQGVEKQFNRQKTKTREQPRYTKNIQKKKRALETANTSPLFDFRTISIAKGLSNSCVLFASAGSRVLGLISRIITPVGTAVSAYVAYNSNAAQRSEDLQYPEGVSQSTVTGVVVLGATVSGGAISYLIGTMCCRLSQSLYVYCLKHYQTTIMENNPDIKNIITHLESQEYYKKVCADYIIEELKEKNKTRLARCFTFIRNQITNDLKYFLYEDKLKYLDIGRACIEKKSCSQVNGYIESVNPSKTEFIDFAFKYFRTKIPELKINPDTRKNPDLDHAIIYGLSAWILENGNFMYSLKPTVENDIKNTIEQQYESCRRQIPRPKNARIYPIGDIVQPTFAESTQTEGVKPQLTKSQKKLILQSVHCLINTIQDSIDRTPNKTHTLWCSSVKTIKSLIKNDPDVFSALLMSYGFSHNFIRAVNLTMKKYCPIESIGVLSPRSVDKKLEKFEFEKTLTGINTAATYVFKELKLSSYITIDNIKLYLIQKYLFENTDDQISSDIPAVRIKSSGQPKVHEARCVRAEFDADLKEVSDSKNREIIIHSGESAIVKSLEGFFDNEAIVKQCISDIEIRFNIKEEEGNQNFQTKITYNDNETQHKVYHVSQGKQGGATCTLFFIVKSKNEQTNTIQIIAAGKHIKKKGSLIQLFN